jgi:aerobactin synthase
MSEKESWYKVNQSLVAKAIGELTFEQILQPALQQNSWSLKLSSGITYSFQGWKTTWEHLRVAPHSLMRGNEAVTSAAQFFIDTKKETGMDDIVLANFLEEMHNTLFSDLLILNKEKELTVQKIANWHGEEIQSILNGHPKILLNKGRIGWGEKDLTDYSPESQNTFQLQWLAIDKGLLIGTTLSQDLLDDSFVEIEKTLLLEKLRNSTSSSQDYAIIPIHPWQWNKFISIQYRALIAEKKIIHLGAGGDLYRPQISLRTLSNASRPEKLDIKLPLTILNTSCFRGLPAAGTVLGKEVSSILNQISKDDELLLSSGTEILCERGGVALLHPNYKMIEAAPYRYHEYLAALWRESAQSKLAQDEKAIITAVLMYQDSNRNTLIGEYIKRSGITTEEWLRRYFEVVIIPLYHLQLVYGVGMVAHGQNIILKLRNYLPNGMMLKDFQGDLRLSQKMPEKGARYFKSLEDRLTKLPPDYLIHDLVTGHFVTVLRFISGAMEESNSFPENKFYQILSEVVQNYLKDKNISDQQNILSKIIPRVLLNKVRFSIGYSDSAQRPLPMVGSELKNPLFSEKQVI